MKYKIEILNSDHKSVLIMEDKDTYTENKIIICFCLEGNIKTFTYVIENKTNVFPALYLQNSVITFDEYE